MVPFEAFWMSSPHSSIAFCSGCDGGTQCDSLSSKVLSCADALPDPRKYPSKSASAARPQNLIWLIRNPPVVVLLLGTLVTIPTSHLIAEKARCTSISKH